MISTRLTHHSDRCRIPVMLLIGGILTLPGFFSVGLAQVVTNISPELVSGVGTQVDLNVKPGEHHISRGAIRGNAQFHSFETFSLGTGETARFLDPNVGIEIVLSRVTGADTLNAFPGSSIDGTLISDIPGASFYFLNPRGILFGQNASLDIGTSMGQPGSAYFASADYALLSNGFRFNALPEALPMGLLNVPSVTSFGFLSATPGGITVEGSQLFGLTFDPANPTTLALVGGAININSGAFLLASGGNLLLAAAASSGLGRAAEVTLPAPGVAPEITGSQRLPITVSGGAFLDATDQLGGAEGRGGTVYIRGGQFTLENAIINAFTTGTSDGNAVGIDIKVASMTATGVDTKVETGVGETFFGPATGKGGGILIQTTGNTVTVSDGAEIISQTQSVGGAGPLSVMADTLEVNGGALIARVQNVGPADPLTVTVGTLRVLNGGRIITETSSDTSAGTLDVTAKQSFLLSGTDAFGFTRSSIRSFSSGVGATGTVTVKTESGGSGAIRGGARIGGDLEVATQSSLIDVQVPNGTLTITGSDAAGNPSAIQNVSLSDGQSGPIRVQAGTLILNDHGQIRTISGAEGGVGNITIAAGTLMANNGSIEAGTIGPGDGGAINITTTGNTITLTNGSLISTTTTSTGNAGQIALTGSALNLNNSTITTSTSSSGKAGDITAKVGSVTLSNNAEISSSSTGTTPGSGKAGSVTLNAGDRFVSRNSQVSVGSERADGGNITLNATELVHLIDSQISATVKGGEGKGGNISIDPNFVILQNSSITANAFGGPGGNINVVAGVFLSDPASSITASSVFSAQGTVNIQAPVQNISGSLAPLPKNFVSAAALLAQRCAARAPDAKFSTFVLAGRDGVPPEPGGLLPSPVVMADSFVPAAPGAIDDQAGAVSILSSALASLDSGRLVFAMADEACGR